MYTCEHECADVIVDDKPYRIESLNGFSQLERALLGKKGVVFLNLRATRERLEAKENTDKAERLAARRLVGASDTKPDAS